MDTLDLLQTPHRRYNPLTGQWVLVSPQRTQRPWQGKQETQDREEQLTYDPSCYLCPGNTRVSGHINPDYLDTHVFLNDFPALLPQSEMAPVITFPGGAIKEKSPLHLSRRVNGVCKVVCFSPHHNLTLPKLELAAVVKLIKTWKEEVFELGQTYSWVQIFENKGEIMGCSNPHPHSQIWAGDFIPNEVSAEHIHQKKYAVQFKAPLLLDYVKMEVKEKIRIVVENDCWIVVVPYWAVWPYETLLLPKRQVLSLPELRDEEILELAKIIKQLLAIYDHLFGISFPYSMGWHGAPFNEQDNRHWQLHAHYYPPLLRSATIKKHMVGYEMLAESQRDLTAEQAAEKLRSITLLNC